jgi:hypothetical protein
MGRHETSQVDAVIGLHVGEVNRWRCGESGVEESGAHLAQSNNIIILIIYAPIKKIEDDLHHRVA